MAAGCVVPAGETDPAFIACPWGGAGVTASWPYRLPLPTSSDEAAIGTSAHGVVRAVEALSEGRLVALPFRAERWRRPRSPRRSSPAVGLARCRCCRSPTSPRSTSSARPFRLRIGVFGHLLHGVPASHRRTGLAGWPLLLAGRMLSGPAAELVVVRDTYRAMGWRGHHVQTYQSLAAALERDGTGAGGLLLITTHRTRRRRPRRDGQGLGLINELWDNGSLRPGEFRAWDVRTRSRSPSNRTSVTGQGCVTRRRSSTTRRRCPARTPHT